MLEVISESDTDAATYAKAWRALRDVDADARHLIVKVTPETGDFTWLERAAHDLEGATRGFRFLADKVKATYNPDDPKSAAVIQSIDRHLATLLKVKGEILDRLYGQASATP